MAFKRVSKAYRSTSLFIPESGIVSRHHKSNTDKNKITITFGGWDLILNGNNPFSFSSQKVAQISPMFSQMRTDMKSFN